MRLGVAAALVDGRRVPGDVEVDGDRIAGVGLPGAGRGLAAPGLVDLQVNGFAGVDLSRADRAGYERAGRALLAHGTTAYQPTFITAPEAELIAALRRLPLGAPGALVLGAHLEGPFISSRRLGAHPAAAQRTPDPALLDRLLAAGPVRHGRWRPSCRERSSWSTRSPRAGSWSRLGTRMRPRPGRTSRSTAVCARSRTSSTRCAGRRRATRASRWRRLRAPT